jgi:prolyl oligopeptidase
MRILIRNFGSYRWLEDDKSAETGAWSKPKTSNLRISQSIPFRECVKSKNGKLCELQIGAPFKEEFHILLQKQWFAKPVGVVQKDAKRNRNGFLRSQHLF